jgi:hypothetical protein
MWVILGEWVICSVIPVSWHCTSAAEGVPGPEDLGPKSREHFGRLGAGITINLKTAYF